MLSALASPLCTAELLTVTGIVRLVRRSYSVEPFDTAEY